MTIARLSVVTVVVLIVLTVSGPTAAAQGFGFHGGPLLNNFTSDDLDFNNRLGTELGLFFGGHRTGIIGLQGEVNWLRKESKTGGNDVRIDYIQLPALLRINIGTKSKNGFAFYGLGGSGVNLKIGDDAEGLNVGDAFKTVDIPLLFGGGVEITRIIIEGRFEQGLLRIDNDLLPSSVKSRSFTVLFGFRIN